MANINEKEPSIALPESQSSKTTKLKPQLPHPLRATYNIVQDQDAGYHIILTKPEPFVTNLIQSIEEGDLKTNTNSIKIDSNNTVFDVLETVVPIIDIMEHLQELSIFDEKRMLFLMAVQGYMEETAKMMKHKRDLGLVFDIIDRIIGLESQFDVAFSNTHHRSTFTFNNLVIDYKSESRRKREMYCEYGRIAGIHSLEHNGFDNFVPNFDVCF